MAREPQAARPATIASPHRRGLLTGTIAALLTCTAVATAGAAPLRAAGDDAELIRLCGDFHRLTAAMAGWSVDDDDGFDAKMSERWAVSDRIMLLSATTDTGRRQKAAVALVGLEENYKPTEGQTIRTTLAALRDIAGTAVAATASGACLLPPAAGDDDAELLSACEAFWRHERHIVAIDTKPLEDFHAYGTTECEAEERETADALDAWNESVETITDLAPSTRAGVLAKVAVSRAALHRHVAGTTQEFYAKSSITEDLILSVFNEILDDGSAVA